MYSFAYLKKFVIGFAFLIFVLLILYNKIKIKISNSTSFSTQELKQEIQWNETTTNQTVLKLVNKIRKHWLVPPSKENYSFSRDSFTILPGVKSLHTSVLEILKFQKNGFFIECGAYDGVDLSNTLHLEMDYNWTGLLIEVDPRNYKKLESKHRKAWIINACLAIRPEEHNVRMTHYKNSGAITLMSQFIPKSYSKRPNSEEYVAHCFPLTTLLNALGRKHVDYLSLDIEYAELKVLKTVEWNSVYIKVITLEAGSERVQEIKDYLATKNYTFIKNIKGRRINDNIFVHKTYLSDKSKPKM